jgi:hypothetical protein
MDTPTVWATIQAGHYLTQFFCVRVKEIDKELIIVG